MPLLAAVIVSGGILGPVFMLLGLQRLSGMAGALLLNLEAPFTILLAVLVFKEHLGRREAAAASLIVSSAALLAYSPGAKTHSGWAGVLFIAAACACWALDNNLTQRLSLRDPIALVRIKGLGAGSCILVLVLFAGERWPSPSIAAASLVLGLASYGLSVVLHVHALRALGAARQAALFSIAPFVGAAAAVPLLGERPGPLQTVAAVVMAAGVSLLLHARHRHLHVHDEMEHDHLHVHDEHHQHAHEDPVAEPHAHLHRHASLAHDHPHVSDLHHRHKH